MKNIVSFLLSIILFFLSIIVFLSIFSYTPVDIAFLNSPPSQNIHNLIGIGGAYLGFALFFTLGYAAYFIPLYFFCLGLSKLGILRFWGLGRGKAIKSLSFLLFIIFLAVFIGLFFKTEVEVFKFGGVTGVYFSGFAKKYLGFYGAIITLSFLLIISAVLLFGLFFVDLFSALKKGFVKLGNFFNESRERRKDYLKEKQAEREEKKDKFRIKKEVKPKLDLKFNKEEKPEIKPEIKVYTPKITTPPVKTADGQREAASDTFSKEKVIDKEEMKKKIEDLEKQSNKKFNAQTYKLPQIDVLKVPPAGDYRQVKEDIQLNIRNLEDTLSDFGVEVRVVSVQKGPVVTMYELQPQSGVKIQRISTLADDIALAMKSSSVRIVAPIPGRGTVGIEVPNEKKQLVYLREVLEEKVFINSPSKLTLAIGKDVSGNPVVADLKEMPHLLIAGATGSGKTVCVNSLISSIIFKAKPDEVKFILIDPKMVELAPFAGIPHLIHPIISESKKAFVALSWAVEEMERRYRLLAEAGTRNIEVYNKDRKEDRFPYIIIVIDELADLMIVARESVETSIQRLAQLSRAVGIHLVLATQRPSVDVITGVIKANFPARISFKVASKVDSRTVLDSMGADKLLGKGDLLFLKPGAVKMIRAQGAFIDDADIESLTDVVRVQGAPVYEEGIVEGEKKKMLGVEGDELFDEAVKTILQARQASASILQRRMRVGYTRAARLLDLMEEGGIVGPFCGSKAREILVDPENYGQEKNKV